MGEVIPFRPKGKKKQEKIEIILDKQLLLEVAIVKLWGLNYGFDLVYPIEEYHVIFLQFSDLCFSLMNEKQIIVSDIGEIEMSKKAQKILKHFIKEKDD